MPNVRSKIALTDAELDPFLVTYMNSLYLAGERSHQGTIVVAAVAHVRGLSSVCLSRANRALKGWKKIDPPKARSPIPMIFWALIITELYQFDPMKAILTTRISRWST